MQSLDENEEDLDDKVMNGPNVHDCYEPFEVKILLEMETEVRIDSPRSRTAKRSSNLICKVHDLEENNFEIIPKACKLENIRRFIDARKKVEFGYCTEELGPEKVKSIDCQTEIANPAILITLPHSKKVKSLKLRSDKLTYENRINTKNNEQYTISFAAKYRNDGYSSKFGKFPTVADKHLLEPLYDFNDNCGKN